MGDKAAAIALIVVFGLFGLFCFWAGAAWVSFQNLQPILHNIQQNASCDEQANGTCQKWRVECTGTVNNENPMTGVMWLP